ncbi:MAG: hypothetical protein LC747_06860, partial [Acidobacteria bacterium]|nr:hypothetical protein [Acidobacteriota bacterium]
MSLAQTPQVRNQKSPARRLPRALLLLAVVLIVSTVVALWSGFAPIKFADLRGDEMSRLLFFRLRLPRVLMAGMVG